MPQKLPESPENAAEAPEPPCEDDARRRAAAYLDLWEGHLVHLAVEGVLPPPGRQRR